MYFILKRRRHNLITALLARQASPWRRRAAWVYLRPQGWFEEMYQNPVLSALWNNDFRVSKETFDCIYQLVGPDLSKQNTCSASERLSPWTSAWQLICIMEDRNNLRTEIHCNKDMWKLHGSNNTPQGWFYLVPRWSPWCCTSDEKDGKYSWISKCCWSNRWFPHHHKSTSG